MKSLQEIFLDEAYSIAILRFKLICYKPNSIHVCLVIKKSSNLH